MPYWWDPFEEIERMKKRMRAAMEGFMFPAGDFVRGFPVDIEETEDELILTAELPGFDKDEVVVNVTENSVEITAQHKEQKEEKTKTTYRSERRYGALRRFITLPTLVKFEEGKAEIKNGLLKIVLPKKEKKKASKKLEVK